MQIVYIIQTLKNSIDSESFIYICVGGQHGDILSSILFLLAIVSIVTKLKQDLETMLVIEVFALYLYMPLR